MKHVYGPVPSRRLGRSLGIDLVPYKTCSFDCIYCQLKRTTLLTTERREWYPLDDVVEDVKSSLSQEFDYITLSGSGDPTLYSRLGELIDRIHSLTDRPVAVLTNGSLLWREDVRQELKEADLLIPSLDAGDEETFQLVNRPTDELNLGLIVEGLIQTREQFRGELWLEIMLVNEWNTSDEQVQRIADQIRWIRPNHVQLNTVIRPATETYAVAVPPGRLGKIATHFSNADVIAGFSSEELQDAKLMSGTGEESVMEMLIRRPCTLQDLSDGLQCHPNEAVKALDRLQEMGKIRTRDVDDKMYYLAC